MTRRSQYHAPTSSLFVIVWIAGVSLLILFAWQTWEFVNYLFPDDEVLYRFLTFACFDIMALIWGCLDMFARIIDPRARNVVRAGWIVTYLLSGIATVLYMSIQGYFRFHLQITPDMLNIGYTVSIFALVFNAAIFTSFVYIEGKAQAQAKVNRQRYVRRKTSNAVTQQEIGNAVTQQLAQNSVTQNNVTPIEVKREQTRLRVQRHREKQRARS